jgi:putative endonuclease
MRYHNYFVYITTNFLRTVLYTGVTNNLARRIQEQKTAKGNPTTFSGRYNVNLLIYWERYSDIRIAIAREKEVKKLSRARKEALIAKMNPTFQELDPD